MVRCQYISVGLNVHNGFKQGNELLKYKIPEYKKIENYSKYLKIKYTFNFNDYFSFFLISNDVASSKNSHLINI